MLTRLRLIALVSIVGASVVGAPALTVPAAAQPAPKDTVLIAWRLGDTISADPAESFEFTFGEINNNVYDKLMHFVPPDLENLVPSLAESVAVSDDQLTYTFKTRKGVKFHSGNPFTAQDAAFSLQRAVILDKTPAFILKQFGFTAANVKEMVRATDDDTLVIRIANPVAPTFFLNCLTANVASIVDMKLLLANEKAGDLGYDWLKTRSAGSGAFKLQTYRALELIALERHDGYWRGAPQVRRVIFRHVAESAAQRLLLEKGDIDIARNLGPDDIDALSTKPGVKVRNVLRGRLTYLSLNQKVEALRKPEVHEAFKWLIDYEALEKSVMRNQGVTHQNFLPKGFLGAIEDRPYRQDLDKARALLKQAGLEGGFSAELIFQNGSPELELAQAIQASAAKVGIKLTVTPMDGRQLFPKYRARAHEIFMGRWGPDYPDPHTNAYTFAINPDNSDEAKQGGLLSWRNAWDIPEMTRMSRAALAERDGAKRAALYGEIQRLFLRTAPFAIMYQQVEPLGERDNVRGFDVGVKGADTFFTRLVKN